jgi:hypothetical protein
MMIGVVAVSLLFAMVRLANELRYWTFSYGWNSSVLGVGQKAVVCKDVDFYGQAVPVGTRVRVTGDLTDEDSAYPYRKVSVEVIEGPQKGAFGTVERSLLRVQ